MNEKFTGAAQLLHAALMLSKQKWRGLQPKRDERERFIFSPKEYKEYCEDTQKADRKRRFNYPMGETHKNTI